MSKVKMGVASVEPIDIKVKKELIGEPAILESDKLGIEESKSKRKSK